MRFFKPKSNKQSTDNLTVQTQMDEQVETQHSLLDSQEDYKNKSELNDRRFVFKRLVDKKLTIILIENTTEVAKEMDTLIKNVKSLVPSGLVSIINYGTTVRQSEIFDVSTFDDIVFLCHDDIGDKACLYDALVELKSLIFKEYFHIEEKESERVRIDKIEVIGIGTCKDNCSKVSKQVGIGCFCQVAAKQKVITKYFCLTEETFMDAAEIGFRSIGAIYRNY